MALDAYIEISHAINQLMGPLVETVIHDLHTNKIIFIEGFLSKRKVGDPSLLEDDIKNLAHDLAQTVYSKLNFDGRLIKSISIPIKEKHTIVALLCINFDITVFQELGELAHVILNKQMSKQPEVLFKNDWQERINEFVYNMLKKNELSFDTLTNKDKQKIVQSLYEQGAFSEKNAAEYIAKIMDMSRATIFNYLRKLKGGANAS